MFDDFIRQLVENEAVKVPLYTITYEDEVEGHTGVVSHFFSDIIYSEFDGRLARHLYATLGLKSPGVHVVTTFRLAEDGKPVATASSRSLSALHALTRIGENATRSGGVVELTLSPGVANSGFEKEHHTLDAEHFDAMRRALDLISQIADPVFCRVSADLDGAMVFMPGTDDVFFELDFRQGLLTMPPSERMTDQLKVALYNFDRERREKIALRARLRLVKDMIMAVRKEAVDDFCHSAEREITEFDHSLKDKAMSGHRQDIVMELVTRLRLAFGEDLKGLSPHARLLALDWASADDPAKRKRIEHDPMMAAE